MPAFVQQSLVGYKKENLIAHVGNVYRDMRVEYIVNPVYDKTNNIYSLYLAKDCLRAEDTILLESDLIFEQAILERLLNDPRKSLVVVDKYQSWMDGTSVTLDEHDSILNFFSKKSFRFQDVDSYYKTVNIYKFSKEFSTDVYVPFLEAYSKAVGDNEYYESVLRVLTLLDKQELKALRLSGEKWYEIDDIQDKLNAEIIFAPTPEQKLKLTQARYGGYWRFPELKDFCYLVNPYFPTGKMQEEMKTYFHDLISQYPSGLSTQNILAGKVFSVEAENILVGNGAAEIINGLADAIDGKFGIIYPSFNEYGEAIGLDRVEQFVPKNDDFSYNVDELLAFSEKIDTLILINPDNPTGHFMQKNKVLQLLQGLRKADKTLLLDESFVDFSSDGEANSLIQQDILDDYKNLLIIKSISKSYGVPGIRLGVAVSSNLELLQSLRKSFSIWNVNSFGEFFLQTIGKYKSEYRQACKQIQGQRDAFFAELGKISFMRVLPSQANYFICELKSIAAKVFAKRMLNEHNILIKDLTGKTGIPHAREYVRVAVRDEHDNRLFIDACKRMEAE